MTGDNVRDLIAEAISGADCDQQPKCVWCMTMSVICELDRGGMVVVSAEDLDVAVAYAARDQDGDHSPCVARLRAALPERSTDLG
jgi:hypothetical protein